MYQPLNLAIINSFHMENNHSIIGLGYIMIRAKWLTWLIVICAWGQWLKGMSGWGCHFLSFFQVDFFFVLLYFFLVFELTYSGSVGGSIIVGNILVTGMTDFIIIPSMVLSYKGLCFIRDMKEYDTSH